MCGDVMMVIVLTIAYLFTQRGNYRQNIFQNDEDRLRYLSWIKKTYLVGTSIGNKGVYCEVREKIGKNIKRLAERHAEETKAQINNVCP